MAAKKNKAKTPSKNQGYRKNIHWLEELPQEMVEFLRRNRKGRQIHCLFDDTNVTKTWVPATSRRCSRERLSSSPQLRLADESYYLKHCAADSPFMARVSFSSYLKSFRDEIEFTLVDPFNIRGDPQFQNVEKRSYMDLYSMAHLDGKSYALSLQGTLVLIETIDSVRTITGLGSNRAVPSLGCRFFREFLIELDGEIILIFLTHQESLGIVDGVEVFRLCLRKLKWYKAERLAGKVVCLAPRSVWANSAEIGCKGDRIYFTQASFSGWVVYDMETCSISSVCDE